MPHADDRLVAALADRYRIGREVGAGGMALVYVAEDLKHHRPVAMKVLRPELAAMLGVERFLKEIEVTASLQHPNILPLHDSGEAAGFLFYVMPHVSGESLRERLVRDRPLPVEEAVAITRAVASALDSAHRRGVLHRDVKPENILLSEGQALVADFGIALAVNTAGGSRLTETGMSLGTPHYMSPEQAVGERSLDGRSDIYSLGATAYEMLAGEPPFTGASAQAILAKIVTGEPTPLTSLRKTVPAHVDSAVRTALEKLPADRFATAADFAAALANPAFALRTPAAGVTPTSGHGAARWRRVALGAAASAALLAVALGVAVGAWMRASSEPRGAVRFEIEIPATDALGPWPTLAVRQDGRQLAYTANGGLWVRGLDEAAPRSVGPAPAWLFPGTLMYSPDGTELVLPDASGLLVHAVTVGGGPPRVLADSSEILGWADEWLYGWFSGVDGLARRAAAGGQPASILGESDTVNLRSLSTLSGGRRVLLTLERTTARRNFAGIGRHQVAVLDVEEGSWRTLVDVGEQPAYLDPGYLVFLRDGVLLAAPFDARRATLTGEPRAVMDSVAAFAVGGGTLVVLRGGFEGRVPVLRTRTGARRPIANLPGDLLASAPSVSPDGTRIAFVGERGNRSTSGIDEDVWVFELPDGPLTRLAEPGPQDFPAWTPDGSLITYARDGGYSMRRWDGTGDIDVLLDVPDRARRVSWLPDGRRFVFDDYGGGSYGVGVRAHPDSVVRPAPARMGLWSSTVSRDGRWIASHGDGQSRREVYVQAVGGGAVRQVSRNGGERPIWSHGGRELFYLGPGDSVFSARLSLDGEARVESIRGLFGPATLFDVLPGDSLFVTTEAPGIDEGAGLRPHRVVVVVDVVHELRRLFAASGR